MARTQTVHRCAECGAEAAKWSGQCATCGAWNALVEEPRVAARGARTRGPVRPAVRIAAVPRERAQRVASGIAELDFVLGGGFVPGGVVLVGGDPGIGKSTLLLQAAAALQREGNDVLYVSAEESIEQVALRSARLQAPADDVAVSAETDVAAIVAAAEHHEPSVLFVDSIQTVATDTSEGAPGTVGQVRESAARLVRFAKESGVATVLVGHVTKDGGIAGPKALEHLVDTVLYFEAEGGAEHRILRATKNRFGSVDEIAVFRMTGRGLIPVGNPSALFLGDRSRGASGSAAAALMEGTRPLLVEVQALAARAGFGTPQRVAAGFESRRLALLLAVLDKRAGLSFAQLDVFANVVGGLRIVEPAADLALAAALASSVYDRTLDPSAVFIGEIGLGGEVRGVTGIERRLAEAAQLGFRTAYIGGGETEIPASGRMRVVRVADLPALLRSLFGEAK